MLLLVYSISIATFPFLKFRSHFYVFFLSFLSTATQSLIKDLIIGTCPRWLLSFQTRMVGSLHPRLLALSAVCTNAGSLYRLLTSSLVFIISYLRRRQLTSSLVRVVGGSTHLQLASSLASSAPLCMLRACIVCAPRAHGTHAPCVHVTNSFQHAVSNRSLVLLLRKGYGSISYSTCFTYKIYISLQ